MAYGDENTTFEPLNLEPLTLGQNNLALMEAASMFEAVRALYEGFGFHIKGIRLAFRHPSFLTLSTIPFLITLFLYILAFYLFTLYADDLLQLIWHIDSTESSKYVEWLYWAYVHIVKYLLYIIVLVGMFYTFIVLSNILASPVYDHISTKYERIYHTHYHPEQATSPAKGALRVMKEEVKKAVLMLVIPLLVFELCCCCGFYCLGLCRFFPLKRLSTPERPDQGRVA